MRRCSRWNGAPRPNMRPPWPTCTHPELPDWSPTVEPDTVQVNDLERLRAASQPAEAVSEALGKTHVLKVWPDFYAAIASGRKTFEIRKDDRDFAEGDRLLLREWDSH